MDPNKKKIKKQDAKTAAKTAASTGSLTKDLRQDLRINNVKPSVIQNIVDTNKQAVAANQKSASAAAGVGSFATGIDQQAQSGQKIDQDYYNSLAADNTSMPSAESFATYAKDKGYVLGDQFMKDYGTTTRDLRFPSLPANSRQQYLNYDFGKSFGGRDIENLVDAGYNNRQIFQLAQAADAGMQVKKRNKVDRLLSTMSQKALSSTGIPGALGTTRMGKKQVGWEGFGNALSKYEYGSQGGLTSGYNKVPGGVNLRNELRNGLPSLTTQYTPKAEFTELVNNYEPVDSNTTYTTDELPTEPTEPTDTINTAAGNMNDPFGTTNWALGWRGSRRRNKMGIKQTRAASSNRGVPTTNTLGM